MKNVWFTFFYVNFILYICIIIVPKKRIIMSGKKTVTLSIDEGIKTDFKIETILNGTDMSTPVEGFMGNYVKMSKQLRDERKHG